MVKYISNNNASNNRKLTAKCGKVGRPISSNGVRVVPVFRKEIDVAKLGRAALRLAMLSTEGEDDET